MFPLSMGIWKAALAVSTALMVVVGSAFSLMLLESVERQPVSQLGYSGAAIRVVAIPIEFLAPGSLTAALMEFAADSDMSIAYSRSYDSGLVTIYDERHHFRSGRQSLTSMLNGGDSVKTAIMSVDAIEPTTKSATIRLPSDVTVTASFDGNVMFEGGYPVVVFSPAAIPFAEGIYLFTVQGTSPSAQVANDIVNVFQSNGMDIVELTAVDSATVQQFLLDLRETAFGIVFLLFSAFVVISQILVSTVHAGLLRGRLVVAAVIGASRGHIRSLGRRSLLTGVLPGLAAGIVIASATVLGTDRFSLVEAEKRLVGVGIAAIVVAAISVLACWLAAWREAREVARVVVC